MFSPPSAINQDEYYGYRVKAPEPIPVEPIYKSTTLSCISAKNDRFDRLVLHARTHLDIPYEDSGSIECKWGISDGSLFLKVNNILFVDVLNKIQTIRGK